MRTMNTILTTQCDDDVGLIAKITGLCHEHNLNITRNNEFVDKDTKRFFMRTELSGTVSDNFLPSLATLLPDGAELALHSSEKTIYIIPDTIGISILANQCF